MSYVKKTANEKCASLVGEKISKRRVRTLFFKMKSQYLLWHVKAAIIITVCLALTNSSKLDQASSLNAYYNKILNTSQELKDKWLVKAAIPSYLRDTLAIFKNTNGNVVRRLEELLDGVKSDSCKAHVAEWFWKVDPGNSQNIASDEEKWVLQMVDAWGKLPEGILAGHVNAYGDFDECVQIKVDDLDLQNDQYFGENIEKKFAGKYCTSYMLPYEAALSATPKPPENKNFKEMLMHRNNSVHEAVSLEELLKLALGIKPTFMQFVPTVGVCLPSSCSNEDIQQILMNDPDLLLWPVAYDCMIEDKPPLEGAAIVVITIIGIFIALVLIAGIVDYWRSNYSGSNQENLSKTTAYKYLMAFSFYTNIRKMLSTRKSAEDLGCLHGIRFFSTSWVILSHTYVIFMQAPQWNRIDISNIYKDWTILAVINGGYSVDTFFTMSGMLVAYNLLKMLDKTKGKINIPMMYLHRYIRLTPTYAILLGIAATLFSYAGNGPGWAIWEVQEDWCRRNWWTNILYINNVVKPDEMCYGVSWYLANDMQFYVLAPLIIYPIWKWEVLGGVLLTIYTILGCIAPVLVVRYAKDAPPAMVIGKQGESVGEIYDRPWSRINVFLVGIWLGWVLHKTRGKNFKLSKIVVLGLWMMSTGTALAVIFAIFPWFDPVNEIPKAGGYFYAGLCRFSWAVAISWVMFACIRGYGGAIDRFLSWRGFMPLGRICFCAYLTSYPLQSIFHSRLSVPMKWDTYTLVNIFFAHMVVSFLAGFVFTTLFESPFITLQKLIFDKSGDKSKKDKSAMLNNARDIEKNNNNTVDNSIKANVN